jgi:metallophosphoesterase superfamily enzyme
MIEPIDNSLYIPDEDILCFSDLHIGKHIQNDKTGSTPKLRDQCIKSNVSDLIQVQNPSKIVFNGDTFHYVTPTPESKQVVTDIIERFDAEFVFIVGNHERTVESLEFVLPEQVSIHRAHSVGEFTFHHGHENQQETNRVQIIGHLHPASFLCGTNKGNEEIVICPSTHPSIDGSDKPYSRAVDICPSVSQFDSIQPCFR